MSSSAVRRLTIREAPTQPVDRHLAEIGESDGSVYINAGIDSTCCRKRGLTLHTLTNGIVVSSDLPSALIRRNTHQHRREVLAELASYRSSDDRYDVTSDGCCTQCGK